MTLLQRIDRERRERRERLRAETLRALRPALEQVLPGHTVYVYGSLLRAEEFHDRSDIDLALVREPASGSIYRVQSLLEERLGRHVDLCLLAETRLRAKIEREGQRWTISG